MLLIWLAAILGSILTVGKVHPWNVVLPGILILGDVARITLT